MDSVASIGWSSMFSNDAILDMERSSIVESIAPVLTPPSPSLSSSSVSVPILTPLSPSLSSSSVSVQSQMADEMNSLIHYSSIHEALVRGSIRRYGRSNENTQTAVEKLAHKELERRRRETVNQGIERLRRLLPGGLAKTVPKATVIQCAASYLERLLGQKPEVKHEDAIVSLAWQQQLQQRDIQIAELMLQLGQLQEELKLQKKGPV